MIPNIKQPLTTKQSESLFNQIISGYYSDQQLEEIIRDFMARDIEAEELTGAVLALSSSMKDFPIKNHNLLFADIVGTGGDTSNSINISTISALLASAMGYPIAKHGNRAVSSLAGSSDFLSQMGVKLDIEPYQASRLLASTDFTFLFAPKYHTGFRFVANIRAKIKQRTIFNLLGPLLNPSKPPLMLIGVYDKKILDLYSKTIIILQKHHNFAKKVTLVHSEGLDEAGIHDVTYVIDIFNGIINQYTIDPNQLGFDKMPLSSLEGGTAETNKEIGLNILRGKGTLAQTTAIALNTALLIGLFNGEPLNKNFVEVQKVLHSDLGYKHLTVIIATALEICSPQTALTCVGQNIVNIAKQKYINHDIFIENSILGKIINDKLDWLYDAIEINELYRHTNFAEPRVVNPASPRGFPKNKYLYFRNATKKQPGFVLEIKRRSPSKGLIRDNFDLKEIVNAYQDYATIISVLTDHKYFAGDFKLIDQVTTITNIPVLCKDFIISTFQIDKAQQNNASYILLILAVLTDEGYQYLANYAHQAGLAIFTEVSNEQELTRAVKLNAQIIGINNRNLLDLSINTQRTVDLVNLLKTQHADYYYNHQPLIVSESGINEFSQIQHLKQYVNAFLIGSSLMAQPDITTATRILTKGNHKVCGITNFDDLKLLKEYGVAYAGLIFVEGSKRYVGDKLEQLNLEQINKSYPALVAVFADPTLQQINDYYQKVKFHSIQLHGNESIELLTAMQPLREKVQIIKVLHIDIMTPDIKLLEQQFNQFKPLVDLFLLDSKNNGQLGGTGETFNWHLIPDHIREQAFVAGGLNINNYQQPAKYFKGLDFNSGVEEQLGKKSATKILDLFARIHGYDK